MATLALPSSSSPHYSNMHASSSHSHRQQAPSMTPSSSSHSSTGTKLRSHLLSLLPLLPKHALFHAKLTIHEVASVPFLDGEFATKWRFKNAHNVAGAAISANAAAHSSAGQSTGSLVERGAERLRRMGSFGSLRNQSEPVLEEPMGGEDSPESSSSSSDRGGRTTPMPGDPPPQHPAGVSRAQYGPYLTPSHRPALSAAPSYYQNPQQPPPGSLNFVSQPKGQTPYVPLRKHMAVWSLDVDAAVQMSIGKAGGASEPNTPGFGSPAPGGSAAGEGKEPGWLQSCELKLTVIKYLHEWERKDELAKEGMVLGTVVLNLAEYVGEGLVTRRYLLRDSKTNATLKLSIELAQIGGETRYRSPPLQKGQILGSVAGLMSDDHMRRHARSPLLRAASSGSSSSSIYLPAAQGHLAHPQPLSQVRPQSSHRRTPSVQSAQSMPPQSAQPSSAQYLTAPHPHYATPSYPSPGQSPSPYAQSPYSPSSPSPGAPPQSTEMIIEALFNPFPSQSTAPHPFTYYKPPTPSPGPNDPSAAAADGSEVGDEEGTGGEGSTADESGKGGKRRWWRKAGGAAGPKGRPGDLDLRGVKGRSDTQLATTTGTGVFTGISGASTVTPGTAKAGLQSAKWKWRKPEA